MLLDRNADVNHFTKGGLLAVHRAAQVGMSGTLGSCLPFQLHKQCV